MPPVDATAHVVIRGDGEDLTRLDPDPRRITELPDSARKMTLLFLAAAIATAIAVPFTMVGVRAMSNVMHHSTSEDGMALMYFGPLGIPVVGLTLLCWALAIVGLVTRGKRLRRVESYRRLCAAAAVPLVGMVESSHFRSDENSVAHATELQVRLENGSGLYAYERGGGARRLANKRSTRYTVMQVPQYGDRVMVFNAPERSDLVVVQGNHSWSALHAGSAGG